MRTASALTRICAEALLANMKLNAGQEVHGFRVESVTKLDDLRADALIMRHIETGARLLHLLNDDAENLFSVSFPTPPPDDRGAPHILEHSVLAGSLKYPVREPFFEMVKMSMATFINAMTGWDCTYYPVASNVKKDLFNLADVYFDAVFHPILAEQTFKREAHHLAPADSEDPTGALKINGIVYNEMKGVFSAPESLLYRWSLRGLLPDTVYGRESGGDPNDIPDLTYEDLKQFHADWYHPSNAYFFLYGNITTIEHLEFLSEKIGAFRGRNPAPGIERQPRWAEPRAISETYPVAADESMEQKTYIAATWLAGDATDPLDAVLLRILSLVLFGNEGAPLRKAVVDSRLGADLLHSGAANAGLENTFVAWLKGSEPDRRDAFLKLLTETLTATADAPIDPGLVDAAFQQAAYYYLEVLPMFPLHAMERAMHSWIYGKDPLAFLQMGSHVEEARLRLAEDPGLLNGLIRERLLDNPHRLTVVLKPDREMQGRLDADFAGRMKRVRERIDDGQARKIAEDAEELERQNGQPNDPAALEFLPQLKISDLPDVPLEISSSVETIGAVRALRCDIFSNGVNYLSLNFNMAGLPERLWPYLPRYADCISKLGVTGMNYEQTARRVASATGGIGCAPWVSTHALDPNRSLAGVGFSMKMLDDGVEPALSVLHDLLFSVDPRDTSRLRDVLTQALAGYRTDMVHEGSGTARHHAGRGLTREGHIADLVNGLPQLDLTEDLAEQFEKVADDLALRVEEIRDFLLNSNRLSLCFTGSDSAWDKVKSTVSQWVKVMRNETVEDGDVGFKPFDVVPREGLAGPIQVNYCVQLMPAPHFSDPDTPALGVAAHLVDLDYMLNEIRFKGNAYGAWFSHDAFQNIFQMGSYRDPHVVRTLDVFAGLPKYVRATEWSGVDIDRAIISVAKNYRRPIRPGPATGDALRRKLTGVTAELRGARYEALKRTTARKARSVLLQALEKGISRAPVCVVASRSKLEEANSLMPGAQLSIRNILRERIDS